MSDKKTQLYDRHQELGGKIVSFGGYALPVQYEAGLVQEHNAVREDVGIFDVSHMGEITIKGPDALDFVNYVLTNSFDSMEVGECRYTNLVNDEGKMLDDLIVYKRADDHYWLVPNAANKDKDLDWINKNKKGDIEIVDETDQWSLLAVQGPKAQDLLQNIVEFNLDKIGYYKFVEDKVDGKDVIISRTGYTGEDGFEIYCANDDVVDLFDKILEVGKEYNILPAGLGCRDSLRLEAGMPLYGNEMDETIDPYEAGLGFAVKLDKDEMIGKEALTEAKENLERKRAGFKVIGRGIAREGTEVQVDGKKVGEVTSGTHSPTLGEAIGMVLIDTDYNDIGQKVDFIIRNKPVEGEIIKMPFIEKEH